MDWSKLDKFQLEEFLQMYDIYDPRLGEKEMQDRAQDLFKEIQNRGGKVTPAVYDLYINAALIMAATSGNLEILQFLINSGATDYRGALKAALESNHPQIVIHLFTSGFINIKEIVWATEDKNISTFIKVLAEIGDKFPRSSVLTLLDKNTGPILNKALLKAVENNSPDVVNTLIDLGARNFDQALEFAQAHGSSPEIIDLLATRET